MNLVFIIGAPRSGTTWLWSLLVSSTKVEPLLVEDFPDIGKDPMKLQDGYRSSETTIFNSDLSDEIIKESILSKLHDNPGKIIVEKTPIHTFHLKRILKLFPEAKILHMIRDPRAVITSILKTEFDNGYKIAKDLEEAINTYALYYSAVVPFYNYKNIKRVRYEDLSNNTKQVFQEVLEFCNIDLDDMSEKERIVNENQNKVKVKAKHAFRKGKIDSYKQELEPGEIKEIEQRLDYIFKDYDYE